MGIGEKALFSHTKKIVFQIFNLEIVHLDQGLEVQQN